MIAIIHWLPVNMLPCFYKQALGFACPLCGGQRAVVLLCRGKLLESLLMFPPLLPLAATLVLVLAKMFVLGIGKRVIHVALIVDAIMLAFNMVYQNLIV